MKVGNLAKYRFKTGRREFTGLGVVIFIGERDDFGIRCKVFFPSGFLLVDFVDNFEVICESR